MWLKILKYVAQAAVSLGLVDKAKDWISKKLDKSEEKLTKKVEKKLKKIDEVYNVLGASAPVGDSGTRRIHAGIEGQEYARTDR